MDKTFPVSRFYPNFNTLVEKSKKKRRKEIGGRKSEMGVKTGNGKFWDRALLTCFDRKFGATVKVKISSWGFHFMRAGSWAIVQTRPNGTGVALRNLQRQGFEYYNPVISERVGRSFRRVQLFTNYLFVFVVDQWRCVKSTVGVKDFVVGAGGKFGTVPKDFIAALRARENNNGVIQLPKQKKFQHGQKVLTKDLLLEGIYEGQCGVDRCAVLFKLLGSFRSVEMNEGDLVAA